jgi:hypothetical protein
MLEGMRWASRMFVAGGLLFVASLVVLAFGNWYLVCAGGTRRGIDCLDYAVWPSTDTAPASWLGFQGWLIVAAASFVTSMALAWRMRHAGRLNRRGQG